MHTCPSALHYYTMRNGTDDFQQHVAHKWHIVKCSRCTSHMMITYGEQAHLFLQTHYEWSIDVTVVISQFIPPILGVTICSVGIGVIWIGYTATSKTCILQLDQN